MHTPGYAKSHKIRLNWASWFQIEVNQVLIPSASFVFARVNLLFFLLYVCVLIFYVLNDRFQSYLRYFDETSETRSPV